MRQRVEVGGVLPFFLRIYLLNVIVPNNGTGDLGKLDHGNVSAWAGGIAPTKLYFMIS